MPAKSKSQQRFFGMVDAYKKGELKNASKKIKDAAKGMSKKEVKKFASTKTKGLPEKVDENKVTVNESQLKSLVKEAVHNMLCELDWKTYANAARKRLAQYSNNLNDVDKLDKYLNLAIKANKAFEDEFVGDNQYDTLGDKFKKKSSPKFSSKINLSSKNIPYGAVTGSNKSKDKIFSTDKGKYHSSKGLTKPGNFFRDKQLARDFERANDELWDYAQGKYKYKPGEGYVKEAVSKAIKKVLKENLYNDEFYSEEDYNGNTGEPGMVKSYDIGTYYLSQAEEDAKENGYDDVADYLDYWFNEIKQECPWYWQKIGSGYGYNGNTIFKNGQVVCKDIFDQIIIDEYPLGGI